jgi:hypothetical protein
MNFRLAETCARCAGQDDDPHSESRAELVRVKPDKHRPVLWDEKKPPELLSCSQRNLSQPSHRPDNRQAKQGNKTNQATAKQNPTTALLYYKRIF